ncbi:MAG TPA: hypothetical protein VOA88_11225 [Candidatus Dormibacteraeota bacterium]|nr:hypothetical protein [Candidatus Dormibacteraeota bacterium]
MISAAILLAIAGGYFARNEFRYEYTDDAQAHAHVMPLGARINGYVNDVFVSEGQLVRAGKALVTIVWPQVERPCHESGFDSLRCCFPLRTAVKCDLRWNPLHNSPISVTTFRVPSSKVKELLVLTSPRCRAIIGLFDILVDIGVPAEKEVIQ